ncbi:uncharacterized protein LOC132312272 [Cornus florida]|uniref:uncharacterized protein LOC132312272 n=1 Tax=Cornus florida TaxID=4283 RepID=UPI0028991804|nr:uncharacterized protein LOC132312272 [Cornus florida]XP_059666557.1 uncharacterized protein LOC132312272 [Cornus florida]
MDENEGGGGFGNGGDPNEQFHRNEAISAVVDEGFLGEEDDDYEDLYNDVNVGEGFLQSLRKNEDVGFRNEEVEKKVESPEQQQQQQPPPPPPPPQMVAETGASVVPGVGFGGGGGDGGEERKFENDAGGVDSGSRVSGRVEGYHSAGFRGNEMGVKGLAGGAVVPPVTSAGGGGGGMRIELGQVSGKVTQLEEQTVSNNVPNQRIGQQSHVAGVGAVGNVGTVGNVGRDAFPRQGGGNINVAGGSGFGNGNGGGGGGTILFVGDLHWWTTDAELEEELCKYGVVKEVKFFDEKASGKSKGYCQVEFYDPAAAAACKDGMNGHVFNGRPCVVAYASPFSIKRMGEAQLNRNQQTGQSAPAQSRRGPGDAPVKNGGNNIAAGGNHQGGNDNYRGYGRGNWGRGNTQMANRGPVGQMRNRGGGMGGRGIMGNGGNGFGQGIGATAPLLPPQAMMAQGFDPGFGAPMGRMGNYGGFPGAPTPPFSGILSSFPPVGSVGLPGVAPHVNPAFFGRGMPMNGMGMMPTTGVEGHNMGMWSDPNMAAWTGEEHGGRAGESSYGEEAVSDHQYGEVSHDRGGWPNAMKEKDRGSERDWSGSSERRYRDDREPVYDRDVPREKDLGHDQDLSERRHRDDRGISRDRERERDRDRERSRDRDRDRDRDRERERERDRDRHRDDREKYMDHHRYRDREPEYDDEWERGRSSRTHSKSRLSQEEEQRSRSRDAEYGKRRRLTSE